MASLRSSAEKVLQVCQISASYVIRWLQKVAERKGHTRKHPDILRNYILRRLHNIYLRNSKTLQLIEKLKKTEIPQ